jgi:hypothetical protein
VHRNPPAAPPPPAGSQPDPDQAKQEKKKRTPAWTDRILWVPNKQLHQLAYGRAEVGSAAALR